MTDGWTTSGLDLLLEVRARHGIGRREAIEEALRDAIRSGRLTEGTRVPSSRSLAADLGVARGTVTDAYDQLIVEGWLVGRRGSGTVVGGVARARPIAEDPRAIVGPAPDGDPARLRHDFRPGRPDVTAFPREEWLRSARDALRTLPATALDYGDPQGLPWLRQELAAYLGRARGVRADPDTVLVTTGWSQALPLLCAVLLERGHTELAVEDPCLWLSRTAVERTGLRTPPLAVDEDGADSGTLAPTSRAVLLTPANHMPLGATLSPARRTAFVRWAAEVDGLVIEDDYDGELRYDRQPAGALQGLDPDRVVYAGTTSKSLAPGLRLGWLVAPTSLVADLVEHRRQVDRHGGAIEQATMAELLRSGRFDRHVRRQRALYRRRRDLLLRALADAVPALRPRGIAAGIHLVVELPWSGPSERSVIDGLAERGIAVGALRPAWHGSGRKRGGLVIGYGYPPEHAYPAGVRALVRALAELTRTAQS